MVAEAFVPAFGALGIGGLIAFVIGSVILIDSDKTPGFEIPYTLIGGVAAASAGFLFLVVGMVVARTQAPGGQRARGDDRRAGRGARGFRGEGWARVHGERWRVRSRARSAARRARARDRHRRSRPDG